MAQDWKGKNNPNYGGKISTLRNKNGWIGKLSDKKKYFREWARTHKESRKKTEFGCRIKRNFGITVHQYNDMFIKQEGRCAICFVDQKDYPRRFSVDHNHKTKKVRGLLCTQCNSILGYSRDSIETLKRAICYLSQEGWA